MTTLPPHTKPCLTPAGRPAFVVNVEVFLHRDGRWLLIRRGSGVKHASGQLSGVGGKTEPTVYGDPVFETTARRELAEEVGVDLTGTPLRYVSSGMFVTADGDPVVNVVVTGEAPVTANPYPAAPDEVAEVLWLTIDEAREQGCPAWTLDSLRAAAALG